MRPVNYHTHTPLCCHATGTMEEYVLAAIRAGLFELGFSDHAPMPLPEREGITMAPEEAEPYLAEVAALRDRYADRITIRTGFEVDFPLFDTFDRRYLTDPRIDYLIGSCHFIGDWAFDHPRHVEKFNEMPIDEIYGSYYRIIAGLVASRLFNIVGHFDLVKKFGHRARGDFSGVIRAIARDMAAAGIAAEVNTSGLQKPVREMYPAEDIVRIFFEENVPVTLGADVHDPALIDYHLAEAAELLRKTGYRKIAGFSGRKRFDIPL